MRASIVKNMTPPKPLENQAVNQFSSKLLNSISIVKEQFDFIFAALLMTGVGVFIGGNLLMMDSVVLRGTLPIAFSCLTVILIFYIASKFINSISWGLAITYMLMLFLVYSRFQWLIWLAYALGLLGLISAFRNFRFNAKSCCYIVMMALLAVITILGCNDTYTSFDMLQRLHAGRVNSDTLFHTSIAAMIKNYGVTSNGLHGLVEIPYHVLSHELIAGISILSGASVFEAYGVIPQMLFAPILILSILVLCIIFNDLNRINILMAWTLICLSLAFAPVLFGKWAFWNSYFRSESYSVSIGLFLCGLYLLLKYRLHFLDLILAIILAFLITHAKASVGYIYFGLWALRVVFLRNQKSHYELIILILVGFVTWLITANLVAASSPSKFVPLDFIVNYSLHGDSLLVAGRSLFNGHLISWSTAFDAFVVIFGFIIFHFVFSWLVVAYSIFKGGLRSLFKTPIAVYSAGAVAAGLLVISFAAIPGGAAYYFSNVAFFVSLPYVIMLGLNYFNRLQFKGKTYYGTLTLAISTISLTLMAVMGWEGAYSKYSMHQQYKAKHSDFIDSLLQVRNVVSKNTLLQLGSVEIPKGLVADCWAQPFLFPAISERPWTNVIRPEEGCLYQYYGYSQYGLTASQQYVNAPIRLLSGMKPMFWLGNLTPLVDVP